MDSPSVNFGWLDGVIVAGYLVFIVGLGFVMNRYVHRLSDFLVAGRAAGTSLSVASLIGTELGLVTLMYAAVEGFNHGPAALSIAVIAGAAAFVVGRTGFVIGRLRRLGLLTIPEFYEKRFGRGVRVLGGLLCALAGILNMGLYPKLGAVFLAHATGIAGTDTAETVIHWIMTGLIVLVVAYTVLGGMVAVILTDFLQFIIVSIGLAIGLLYCLTHEQLGWGNITASFERHRGLAAFHPGADGSYGWGFLLWMVLISITGVICWAPATTRTLSARSEKTATRAFAISSLGYFARFAIPYVFGMAAFTWFADSSHSSYFFPEGLNGPVQHAEVGMPMLIARLLPTGLLGLLVAGLMAAFMSTHDSYFLSWGSVISQDIVAPLRRRPLSPRQRMTITRYSIVGVGAFLLVWGVWYPTPESVWTYMATTGTVYMAGASAVLVAGLYWPRASRCGAYLALGGGLFALLALVPQETLGMSPQVIALCTFALSSVGMVVGSLLWPDSAVVAANTTPPETEG